jgi:hypothetical protein
MTWEENGAAEKQITRNNAQKASTLFFAGLVVPVQDVITFSVTSSYSQSDITNHAKLCHQKFDSFGHRVKMDCDLLLLCHITRPPNKLCTDRHGYYAVCLLDELDQTRQGIH